MVGESHYCQKRLCSLEMGQFHDEKAILGWDPLRLTLKKSRRPKDCAMQHGLAIACSIMLLINQKKPWQMWERSIMSYLQEDADDFGSLHGLIPLSAPHHLLIQGAMLLQQIPSQ